MLEYQPPPNLTEEMGETVDDVIKYMKSTAEHLRKIEIAELCKGVHCVDLGESFATYIYSILLANFGFDTAENGPLKFAASRRTAQRGAGRADRTQSVRPPESDLLSSYQ